MLSRFSPRQRERVEGSGIGFSHADVDELSVGPVEKLFVSQADRGAELAPAIEICKERFDVVRLKVASDC